MVQWRSGSRLPYCVSSPRYHRRRSRCRRVFDDESDAKICRCRGCERYSGLSRWTTTGIGAVMSDLLLFSHKFSVYEFLIDEVVVMKFPRGIHIIFVTKG